MVTAQKERRVTKHTPLSDKQEVQSDCAEKVSQALTLPVL